MVLPLLMVLAADPIATLERTACYGTCPAYKVTVWEDGRVEYEGRQYVKVKGKQAAKLTPAKLTELKAAFDEIGYLKLGDGYDCHEATDNPSAITSYRDGPKQHRIDHYYGCRSKKGLDVLERLEKRIDEIVDTRRWVGTKD